MANQKLIDYIKVLLAQNQNKEQIQQNLLQAGWLSGDIEMALRSVEMIPIDGTPLPQTPPVGVHIKYAGFWVRWAAAMIDGFVLSGASIVMGILFAIFGINANKSSSLSGILGMLVAWIYFIFMTYEYQTTLGKKAVGIIVVSDNATNLTLGQIILRETVGKLISTIILMIGYLMVGFTQKKQALHDKIAKTVVVYKDPNKKVKAWVIILALSLPIIAIIGILASIVLVSLNTARSKARDMATKVSMNSIMLEAVAYYSSHTSFVGHHPDFSRSKFPDCSGNPMTNISLDGQAMAVLAKSCANKEKYFCLSMSDKSINEGFVSTDIKEVSENLAKVKTATCLE